MKYSTDFKKGIVAACLHLKGTAEDIEQGLPRRREQNSDGQARRYLGWEKESADIKADEAKARLLRGQVSGIMDTYGLTNLEQK